MPESSYPVRVGLDYRVHGGWYHPYLEGLVTGKAIAARCTHCDRTTFPPSRTCTCAARTVTWTELSGLGTVVAATRGPGVLPMRKTTQEFVFALVAMDGADNRTFGRFDAQADDVAVGQRVRLVRADDPVDFPTQSACFVLLPPDEPKEERDGD